MKDVMKIVLAITIFNFIVGPLTAYGIGILIRSRLERYENPESRSIETKDKVVNV